RQARRCRLQNHGLLKLGTNAELPVLQSNADSDNCGACIVTSSDSGCGSMVRLHGMRECRVTIKLSHAARQCQTICGSSANHNALSALAPASLGGNSLLISRLPYPSHLWLS